MQNESGEGLHRREGSAGAGLVRDSVASWERELPHHGAENAPWADRGSGHGEEAVSYTHLRAHETVLDLVCRLLLEKKNKHSAR